MRFPPPARYFAPVLALVFGLASTWLDYELNLANDLARGLKELQEQADATGARLSKLASKVLPRNELPLLESDLAASAEAPLLERAAVVDASGNVITDSEGRFRGREALQTPFAPAARLIPDGTDGTILHSEGRARLYGAYPVGDSGAWVLVVYDRADAIAAARADAKRQLGWIASAIGLLCFTLWAILHFALAERLNRLARAVRRFGAGEREVIDPVSGGDEVAELSGAFAAMAAKVKANESERAELEREVLNASEQERRRIGRELHDGLGQRLTAASLATNALASRLQVDAPIDAERAMEIARQLRDTIAETRHLSHGLAPLALETGGLTDALAELAQAATRHGEVRVVFECPSPVAVTDPETASHFFRIAQEAVNNALKHAEPTEIRIALEQDGDRLKLEVEDDGEGLPSTSQNAAGIGLRVMRHRAELLGGTLEIAPSPAGGTLVSCQCPYPKSDR